MIRAQVRRRGPFFGNAKRHSLAAERIAHQKCHRVADLARFSRQRGAKKRAHGDIERERRHFLRDVALFSIAPVADVGLRDLEHSGGVVVGAAAMKCRLRQAPLTPPEFAFADQQTLAEHPHRDSSGQLALVKFALLDHEDLIDQVGMIQQDAFLHHHVEANNVAVVASHLPHSGERIAAETQRHAQNGHALWSRRISITVCRSYSRVAWIPFYSLGCALALRPESDKMLPRRTL